MKAWQAVALSLNIDPNAVKRVDLKAAAAAHALGGGKIGLAAKQQLLSWSGPASRFAESKEFNERLEVTIRNNETLPTVGTPDDEADRRVRLSEFASLAHSIGWQIPDGLKGLAKPADQKLADMQQAYDKLRAKTGKAPSQRAVAAASGYRPETVSKRWPLLIKNRSN